MRNKAGDIPFLVATKAGHDNVKEKLQPVRQNLLSHMPHINNVKMFKEARDFVRAYGLQRLKHEMSAPWQTATAEPHPLPPFSGPRSRARPARLQLHPALWTTRTIGSRALYPQ